MWRQVLDAFAYRCLNVKKKKPYLSTNADILMPFAPFESVSIY